MDKLRQTVEALLEYLDGYDTDYPEAEPVFNAVRAALAEPEQKPSGSFVLWQNTLCNPLADPIAMTHSAWHDGYASGVKAEREACAKVCEELVAWYRPNPGGTAAKAIRSRTE